MSHRRNRAWQRWLTCKSAIGWMALANGSAGDWYWILSDQYSELRRRNFVDEFGRVTIKGKRILNLRAA